ncbi:MAG: hypothetical protein ETSY1_23040 [Candidatus Entotheonella factor]|uniref:Carbohydrate-binding domain-containing protein n=1 Tax=Entotheonella factor TaxID=1429438 RepID=W4LI17_ENTF1|nr:hypothetical protein [Candidatus Entotheonella palauensis]ETW97340.1 MAG: hypothetical protein ETSY1_23040 [Candidatus Entotheonella factor]
MVKLHIRQTWDGRSIHPDEEAWLDISAHQRDLVICVDAPFHGDPPPAPPPGSTDALWTYEVIELFLLGHCSHYMEIELGPHGHYLVLQLEGVRHITRAHLPMAYNTERQGARWRGHARLPLACLPPGADRANAYAIRGTGDQRQYFAAFPVPGEKPDFHRLDAFGPFELQTHD